MTWALVEPFLEYEPTPRFHGWRGGDGTAFVRVEFHDAEGAMGTRALPPRRDLRDHSPTGFEWGYGGSGPAQLALAIAAFVLEDDAAALACYQWLKAELIAPLDPLAEWYLNIEEVRKFCQLAPARAD